MYSRAAPSFNRAVLRHGPPPFRNKQPNGAARLGHQQRRGDWPFGGGMQQKQSLNWEDNSQFDQLGWTTGAEGTRTVQQHQQSTTTNHNYLEPKKELRRINDGLKTLLYQEYIETGKLDNVLVWAEQIRQNGINRTPLLVLIGQLNRTHEHLIPPLYRAFLQSQEAKRYIDRPELFLPAIAQSFQSENVLDQVNAICNQINRSSTIYNSPERMDAIYRFVRTQFCHFLMKVPFSDDNAANILKLAQTLRQSGIYRTPLMEVVEHDKRMLQQTESNKIPPSYYAFMAEESEGLIQDRPHIYFPWMLSQLRQRKSVSSWLPIILQMIRTLSDRTEKLPPMLLEHLYHKLPITFRQACLNRDFHAANQIWNFGESVAPSLPYDPFAVILFVLHLWMNGEKLKAQIVQQLLWQLLRNSNHSKADGSADLQKNDFHKDNKVVRVILKDLNACYRQIVINTPISDQTRKQCHQIFIAAIREALTKSEAFFIKREDHIIGMLRALHNDQTVEDETNKETTKLDRVNEVINCIRGIGRHPNVRKKYLDNVLNGTDEKEPVEEAKQTEEEFVEEENEPAEDRKSEMKG